MHCNDATSKLQVVELSPSGASGHSSPDTPLCLFVRLPFSTIIRRDTLSDHSTLNVLS